MVPSWFKLVGLLPKKSKFLWGCSDQYLNQLRRANWAKLSERLRRVTLERNTGWVLLTRKEMVSHKIMPKLPNGTGKRPNKAMVLHSLISATCWEKGEAS